MSVKVMIERITKPGLGSKLPPLLKELRSEAVRQKGYLYGETLHSVDDPNTFLVVSTWSNIDAWHRWSSDESRQKKEKSIAPLLAVAPKVKVYEEHFDMDGAIRRGKVA